MAETRKNQHLAFSGSGTQTIAVDANEHISVFQVDVSVSTDTTIDIAIGATSIFKGAIIANSSPVQLFLYDFGKGRETGVKGDDLNVTMGEASDVFIAYIKFSD